MAEEARKQAKTNRRTAKSAFTRVGKSLVHAVEHKRPPVEVRQVLSKLQGAYETLVSKHEEYATLIDDDEAYAKEEEWLANCQEVFMRLDVDAKMFIESIEKSGVIDLNGNEKSSLENESASGDEAHQNEGMSSMQSVTPSEESPHGSGMTSIQCINQALPDINTQPITTPIEVIDSVQIAGEMENHALNSVNNATPIAGTEQLSQSTTQTGACTFKLEKPSYPFLPET